MRELSGLGLRGDLGGVQLQDAVVLQFGSVVEQLGLEVVHGV